MNTIKIATWNLERLRSRQSGRAYAIQSTIEGVAADVWVLTETRASLNLMPKYFSAHSTPHPDRRPDPDERWASIWSRWSTSVLRQDEWSVTALVDSPLGEMAVHGVVLPYMNEPGPGDLGVPGWSRFTEELLRQEDQWMRIRAQNPARPLVVAGDFNQSLDGSRWYGSRETRQALHHAIDAVGLKCLTAEDVVASRKLRRNHLVDHIFATDRLVAAEGITCWEPVTSNGLRMSDHPGVAVALVRPKE